MIRRLLAVVFIAAIAASQAQAGTLTENFSGSFGPTTTLGGVALGTDTAFTFHAAFDTTTGISFGQGIELFPVTSFTIDIAGQGTFTGIPNADLNVALIDPTFGAFGNAYAVGIFDHTLDFGFEGIFSTATPGFSVTAPTPSVFSGFERSISGPNYNIPLVGVTGGLVFNGLGSAIPTVSLTGSVPEPSSLVLGSLAALGGLGVRARRRRAKLPVGAKTAELGGRCEDTGDSGNVV
jgi:hypothetical protein